MALSVTIVEGPFVVAGGLKMTLARADIESYTANGEATTASDWNLSRLFAVAPVGTSDTAHVFHYDETNGKVQAFDQIDGSEASSTDDAGESWVLALGY